MASSARIDELRKKFDENPRRYFAPLANEYRKAGELEQAISICREYLPQQPGHMSGHIVYGQALFEHSRFDESRHVFETALSLDPENLIALRHLGDIARQSGDTRAARSWYQRVLEADPRNEEIATLMTSLLATTRASQPAASDDDDDEEDDFSQARAFTVPTEPDHQLAKSQDPELSSATTQVVPGAHDWQSSHRRPEHELPDVEDFNVTGVPLSGPRTSIDATAHAEGADESALSESSSAKANESLAAPPIDHDFMAALAAMSDDRPEPAPEAPRTESPEAPHTESASPDEATVPVVAETAQVLDVFEHGVTPAPIAAQTTDSEFDAYFATSAGEPAKVEASTTPAPKADPIQGPPMSEAFVTETMADLYLQQGHLDSALEIYKKLVSQRPDDARLQHRLRVIGEQIQRRAETPSADEARVTEGLTIRQFLAGIIAVGPAPAATPAAETPRATPDADRLLDRTAALLSSQSLEHLKVPTPVAQIASIDEDFGSTTVPSPEVALHLDSAEAAVEAFRVTLPTSELASEVPAASNAQSDEPASQPLLGTPAHKAASELSLDHVFKTGKATRSDFAFDQFFANDLGDGSAKPRTEPQMSPRQGADDIAQFNNWLNGLKKT